MAHVNITVLTLQALDGVYRADQVRKDPAVIKATTKFCDDVRQAARSGSELAFETRAAWRRAGRDERGLAGAMV